MAHPRHRRSLVLAAIACLLLVGSPATAQPSPLFGYLDDALEAMPQQPGDSAYAPGDPGQRTAWREAAAALLAGEVDSAETRAAAIGYRIVALTDLDRTHWILEGDPQQTHPHWGIFVVAQDPALPRLAVQAPHAHYDFRTGRQAARVYRRSGAATLYLNGTHRCSSPVPSPCDGTTTACGDSSEPFRESDQAHTVTGPLQALTEELLAADSTVTVLQLHGFVRLEDDPHIILSNGTDEPPIGTDWVAELLGELLARMDTLTFKVAHVDTGWTRFTGTTNTQGRLLNGSPDPCDLRPDTATGLFVHMEQSYDGLRDNEESWLRVGDAVADAFAPQAIGEARRPTALPTSPLVIRSRPNPFNGSTAITLELRRAGRLRVQVHDLLGRRVATLHRGPVGAGRLLLSWRPEGVAAGRYLLRAEHSQGTVVHPLTYLK